MDEIKLLWNNVELYDSSYIYTHNKQNLKFNIQFRKKLWYICSSQMFRHIYVANNIIPDTFYWYCHMINMFSLISDWIGRLRVLYSIIKEEKVSIPNEIFLKGDPVKDVLSYRVSIICNRQWNCYPRVESSIIFNLPL